MRLVNKYDDKFYQCDIDSGTFSLLKQSKSKEKITVKDEETGKVSKVNINDFQDWSIIRNVLALGKSISNWF